MPQAQPAPDTCPDKRGLMEDVRLAINTVIALNNRQLEAVIAGDFGKLKSLQEELEEARQWKDLLVENYHRHVEEHGC